VHSNTVSYSPRLEPPAVLTSAAIAAVSLAIRSLSSIPCPCFRGTTNPQCANPLLIAKSTLSACISAMVTFEEPPTLLVAAHSRPMAPAPKTRVEESGAIWALLEAWMATPRGSSIAPRSKETLSGNLHISAKVHLSSQQRDREHGLVTPGRRMINFFLKRALEMWKSFCRTAKLQFLADIVSPFQTPLACCTW
jgi:hypothetical protein